MASSDLLINRQRTVHQILGGGIGFPLNECVTFEIDAFCNLQEFQQLDVDTYGFRRAFDYDRQCIHFQANISIIQRIQSLKPEKPMNIISNPQVFEERMEECSITKDPEFDIFRVADVILWRNKNVTMGILVVTLAAWVVFEISGYTLLSLVSSVFLLLFTILFLWAKSAAILNRPAPPLPHLYLSEETVNEAATFIRNHVNTLLSVSEDIAYGRDTQMFAKVALSLLTISLIGSLTDFFTLGYICLVMVLTVPVFYERYEDHIEVYALIWWRKVQQLYARFDEECISKIHKWILEKKKLS